MARLRLNHLELYTEHTFAYAGHRDVWRDASPLDADDVRWLDALCRERGIELSANQNTFGHMERWLAHPEYRARAESPNGWRTPCGGHRDPSVLAPTRENAEFALGLVRELAQHFTSRRVNIGGDEPFELGTGASRADVAARGRGRVYLEHLQRLIAGVHADGREALYWGDILHHHPELVAELPRRDAIALLWHYEAPNPPLPEIVRANLAPYGISAQMLRGFAGMKRVMPFGALHANLNSAFEIFSIDSLMTIIPPRPYQLYRHFADPPPWLFLREARRIPPDPVLDRAAIGFLAIREAFPNIVKEAQARGYQVRFNDGYAWVFERPTLPRFFFSSEYERKDAMVSTRGRTARPATRCSRSSRPTAPSPSPRPPPSSRARRIRTPPGRSRSS